MFGSPLDNMLAQYSQFRQAEPTGAPVTSPTPTSPPGGLGGSQLGSFFSAVNNVTAGGTSTGSSPFGKEIPDLSKATPEQLKYITDTLSNLTYSLPLGGYITAAEANNPNSAFVKGYYGKPMTGGDSGANRLAQSVYDIIGGLPTRPIGTPALNTLPGYTPTAGPSYNDKLGRPYGGPFTTPSWP
jgi:hypothetical protein